MKINIKNISENKEIVISLIVIIACFVLSLSFPAENSFQKITRGVFFLFVIPFFYIKLILKKNIAEFGLKIGNKKEGLLWGAIMLAASAILGFLAINLAGFDQNYNLPLSSANFWLFLVNMLIFTNIVFFLQEFFFRGFLLFYLFPLLGFQSIFFQFGIYLGVILLAGTLTGNLSSEIYNLFPFIILSLTGAVTAYKSRSIIYSWAGGLLFLIFFNAYIIHIIKTQ